MISASGRQKLQRETNFFWHDGEIFNRASAGGHLRLVTRQLKQTAKDNVSFFGDTVVQKAILCRFALANGCRFPPFYQQPQIQHNVFVTLKTKMADIKPLEIPIDSIERDFEDFLSPDSNKRIIFSGPFGIGKTYFLDRFFKNRKEKYLPIYLRPVNYSLLSNEDVFRLIKYDILLQLISVDGFAIEKEFEFSGLEYASFFIGENRFLILQNLLKLLPKIQSTVDGIENFSKLIDTFRKGKKEINDDPDLKMLFEFQHETQENFLLEYDHVSQFIADKLDELAAAKKAEVQLKKVLIIDDLDRLDPEHIFRLFNVFSAHFDLVNYYPNGEEIKDNKFGFDKIIFVCDAENIRKLFAHKYGFGVDYSGYIDKFYSKQIYYLYHSNTFANHIFPYLKKGFQKLPSLRNSLEKTLEIFLEFLFVGNQLNIRDIERMGDLYLSEIITKDNEFKKNEIHLNKIHSPANSELGDYPICIILNILSIHYGNTATLKEKISNAFIRASSIENEYSNHYYDSILPHLVLFAEYEKHKFISIESGEDEYPYIFNNSSYKITSGFENHPRKTGLMWFNVVFKDKTLKITTGLFLKTLTEASQKIIDSGILNL